MHETCKSEGEWWWGRPTKKKKRTKEHIHYTLPFLPSPAHHQTNKKGERDRGNTYKIHQDVIMKMSLKINIYELDDHARWCHCPLGSEHCWWIFKKKIQKVNFDLNDLQRLFLLSDGKWKFDWDRIVTTWDRAMHNMQILVPSGVNLIRKALKLRSKLS